MKINVRDWQCGSCSKLLGKIFPGSVLVIKHKDLYINIEGGNVIITCTNCGLQNSFTKTNIENVLNSNG